MASLFQWIKWWICWLIEAASLFEWRSESCCRAKSKKSTWLNTAMNRRLCQVQVPALSNVVMNLLAMPSPSASPDEPSEENNVVWIEMRSLLAVSSLEGQPDEVKWKRMLLFSWVDKSCWTKFKRPAWLIKLMEVCWASSKRPADQMKLWMCRLPEPKGKPGYWTW